VNQNELPDLIGLGVQSLVANAVRLGISWRWRLATVTEVISGDQVTARYDGDTADISMVSTVGTLVTGARVYVIYVPPSGNFIVGRVSAWVSGQRIATSVRTTSSGTFTAETVTDTVTANLVAGLIYRVRMVFNTLSTVAGDIDLVRIREDSIAGTILQSARSAIPAATGFLYIYEAEYTAVVTGSKTFVFSGARSSGTGSISHIASANAPSYFYVDYIRG
jgi:hypothetical protein